MELIDKILKEENLQSALKQVKKNKGAPGIDKVSTKEIDLYFEENKPRIIRDIKRANYKPQSVRRVHIPKGDGGKRPLGIPTVIDRVIQQAVAQELSKIYESIFSETSFGFRPKRSAHDAMAQTLEYLNEGYVWVIDMDIEKYFDTVNHNRLMSMLREQVNESEFLKLVHSFLKAGVMENGVVIRSDKGVPQGGPLSPLLSNIYLDKLDKELESRGLRFVRYADDCNIYVKSEMAAERVMKSITSWLERKLHLKVNMTKTQITRPSGSQFLGFKYWNSKGTWKCAPSEESKKKLRKKIKDITLRKNAVARPLSKTFKELNQVIRGWINYYRIGNMKTFLEEFGGWMRHRVRVIIVKQWKNPRTIFTNLMRLNKAGRFNIDEEKVYAMANTRKGLYQQCTGNVASFILSPGVLAIRKGDRPGLVNPLDYYLSKCI